MTDPETEIGGPKRSFRSTLWTVVLKAKDLTSPDRKGALESLIKAYWKPLYLFIRRKGNDREASKDIAQGFFTALLEKNYLKHVERGRGKFRTFLLTALERYMADEYDKETAKKRGGGRTFLSLDFEQAESQLGARIASKEAADEIYNRDWTLRVLAQALKTVREEYASQGNESEFEAIRLHLAEGAQGALSYKEVGQKLGLTEDQVRKRIYLGRKAYRDSILEVIRGYTESEETAREELNDLFSSLS